LQNFIKLVLSLTHCTSSWCPLTAGCLDPTSHLFHRIVHHIPKAKRTQHQIEFSRQRKKTVQGTWAGYEKNWGTVGIARRFHQRVGLKCSRRYYSSLLIPFISYTLLCSISNDCREQKIVLLNFLVPMSTYNGFLMLSITIKIISQPSYCMHGAFVQCILTSAKLSPSSSLTARLTLSSSIKSTLLPRSTRTVPSSAES
jgi:hypothetical protein